MVGVNPPVPTLCDMEWSGQLAMRWSSAAGCFMDSLRAILRKGS